MASRSTEPLQHARKHVFAVNDAPDFLGLVRDVLQDEAYDVTTTNYTPRTFEQIAAAQPDVLLIDLVVGQDAGWALLARLQTEAATRQLPLLVTATDRGLLARAARQGQVHQQLIARPFEVDELLETIRALIGHA